MTLYWRLLRNAAPWGTKYVNHPNLIVCFVQRWDSSEYEFSKFVHKIRHLVISAYYYYRLLAQHTTSSDLWSTQARRRAPCSRRRRRRQHNKRVDASVRRVDVLVADTTNPQ